MTAAVALGRPRQLAGVLGLRDVDDVEALALGALVETARRYRPAPPLSDSEFEDTLRHLLGQAVIEEQRYVRRGLDQKPGIVFRAWLYQQLCGRTFDHWRTWHGRHLQNRTTLVPITGGGDDGGDVHDEAAPVSRSRGAPADPADDWVSALGRVHAAGDRRGARINGGPRVGRGDQAPVSPRGAVGGSRDGDGRGVADAASACHRDCLSCGWRMYRQAPNGLPGWHWPSVCVGCGTALEAVA